MKKSMPHTGNLKHKAMGLLRANRWLLLRRLSQVSILGLFLLGPLAGVWIVKGNLSSSLTLDWLPLTDPYVLVQSLVAGQVLASTAVTGALIVTAAYWLLGGRTYCAWVCPINIVTDLAHWCREQLDLGPGWLPARATRWWILAMTLVVAAWTGSIAWELVNPVPMLYRGVLFGMGAAWIIVPGIFVFDLFVSRRGWCGRLCPVGAFYGLIGRFSIIRIRAEHREACNDCMDCIPVCPESQIIMPVLKGARQGVGPVILAGACSNCGRCLDVCGEEVFRFGTRFANQVNAHPGTGVQQLPGSMAIRPQH